MRNTLIIDANIILRYLLADNKQQYETSKKLFSAALKGEITLFIKEIVLAEVVYVLEKVYKVEKNEISSILSDLVNMKGIKAENKKTLLEALKIYKNKNLDIVDCILCALKEEYEVKTFDKKLKKCLDT